MPWCRRAPLADHVGIGLQWRFKSRPAVSAGSREPPPQGRDRVREREPPVAHRLARRERRGLEDGPQGRGAGALPGRGGDLLDLDVDARRPEDLARPVGPRRAAAVDEVVDRRRARAVEQAVLPDELDDRVGDVGRVGRGADLVADDAERLAGVPGAERGPRDLLGEVVARRPVEPGRPRDRERAAPRAAASSTSASAASLLSAIGVDRAPRIVRARSRDRRAARRRRPRWSRPAPAGSRDRRRPAPGTPVASAFRRRARSGSRAQPSTSVQAAAWITISGLSRSISAATDSIVSVSRSRSGRDHGIGPRVPVNGAFSSASISARPSRPRAPVTATRIGQPASSTARPAASRSPYWRS